MKLKLGTILTMAEVRHTDADVQNPSTQPSALLSRCPVFVPCLGTPAFSATAKV